jgi:chromosome partitioning protein
VAPVAASAQAPAQSAAATAPPPAVAPVAAQATPERTPAPAEIPLVTGGGSALQLTCPYCGGPLQRATVAGYRVAYCDHCKYRRQDLAAGVRR